MGTILGRQNGRMSGTLRDFENLTMTWFLCFRKYEIEIYVIVISTPGFVVRGDWKRQV